MRVAADVTELIGETPLVRVDAIAPNLLVKLESFNPYSVKDRIAREMLDAAAEAGEIADETVVIEPTSGNTGIGLATVCAARGHDLILTMPESMSEERRQLLRALGAELELTDADGGMNGAIERADELAAEYEDTFVPQQFQNPNNPSAHRRTTGPELDEATDGELDVFVAGVGTGGTITGVGTYFREAGCDVDLIAVEPEDSAVLSGEEAGSHEIQGIGAGFVPEKKTAGRGPDGLEGGLGRDGAPTGSGGGDRRRRLLGGERPRRRPGRPRAPGRTRRDDRL